MILSPGLTRAIAGFATPIAMNVMERQEVVIKLRDKFNLKHENLPDNFPVVYAYTLVEYGAGKEEALLNLFEQPEIQDAFRCEFRENNPARLEEAVEGSVNWELLDWNILGQQIKKLAADAQQDTTEYVRQEIEDFRKVFYQKVLPLTLKPSQVHQDRRIQEIIKSLEQLKTLDELREGVHKILELLKNVSNYQNQSNLTESVTLNSELHRILNLYLGQCYRDERVAKLDQAGERDSEQETYLNKVFIDLNVSLREEIEKQKVIYREFRNRINKIQQVNEEISEGISEEDFFYDDSRTLSVMECLLQELHPKIVIIGGPGQGKSTSGQQLAQIHRAKLINEDYDDRYHPKIVRIPFQIVLKDFAQWLADEPEIDALDSYLAEKVGKLAKCPGDIRPQDVQEIFNKRNCLLLLDGLDEVVEPKLKKQMLKKIQDFLAERESSTKSNVTVVATSRPNGFDNQFDPEQFIHLELEFLSEEKVTEYAQKWVEAKRLTDEESSKTLNTLKDCQRDKHIQGLLTTPLQVTIILIIIKSGRRPPSQREDLFNEYWLTIFRREESKDSGKAIVKSKESFLLNLHSVLGYSIHRRAIEKNIKSLLSESEFKELVTNFLNRKKGNCTSPVEITQEMNRLVREVGERLVLIVQKEADYYGFDLRSFQEFFAAIYLVQAKNTKQRFDRLTAIAPYEHWRNVALFAAGRIARNFSGEVIQLTEVWRSIDRTGVNRYLKPGAWLALQIAADGALSDEANLQYSAVGDGLKILEAGLTSEQNGQLKTLTGRLTKEEKRKILRPVLEEKLSLLPESCLVAGLSIYGEYFGANDFFIRKLDTILKGQKQESLINSALNLAVKYKSKPSWIAKKFKKHFEYFEKKFENICLVNFEYFKKILNQEELLNDSWLVNLLTKFSPRSIHPLYNRRVKNDYLSLLIAEIGKKKAYSIGEQLIICILLKHLIYQLLNHKSPYRHSFRERMKEIDIRIDDTKYGEIFIYDPRLDFLDLLGSMKEKLQNQIEYLLQYQDLISTVKLLSQQLLLLLNPNNEKYIYDLLNCFSHVQIENLVDRRSLLDSFLYSQPLFLFASRLQIKQEKEVLDKLLPFLMHDKQVEIAQQIENTILNCLKSIKKEEIADFITFIRYKIRMNDLFSDLIPLANQMGIELEELISNFVFDSRYKGDE
ncbi:MAG: NACHT domain-containing protein, partial [Mastigocoleus sp. MO_167.B18]|nr:NACHT domain-containing protein [Mastigocoleus sp. MO_167.B18]